jgi:RNA polymerase sigma-70 factor (ECF subfamily)
MDEEPTTVIIQRYLDALPEDTAAEPVVRELLERAASRLRLLCATFLYKSYPRLTRPPVKLETDELLRGIAAGLIKGLQTARPPTVRRFFALANQHMRWQLNDLARRRGPGGSRGCGTARQHRLPASAQTAAACWGRSRPFRRTNARSST